MNRDQLAERIARELREACPRGVVQPFDEFDESIGLYYMSTQVQRGAAVHLHLLVYLHQDDPHICVHARALCVFADHLTTTADGETLRLPSGEEFPGGSTALSQEFEDGLGNVSWDFAVEDHERAVRLARGLAAIASEYFLPDMLAESLGGTFSSAYSAPRVECSYENFRAARGPFTLSVTVGDIYTHEGFMCAFVWPADLLEGLFVGANTVVLPNGEAFPRCDIDWETDEQRDGVVCSFSYQSEQERPAVFARLHAFVEGVARLAAERFGS